MKLKIILIIFLAGPAISNGPFAQTMDGDWYTPLRNKILHLAISKDSIVFRKCSSGIEMQDYGYADMAFKIEKVVNGNYIVSGTKDTVPTFYLLNFKWKDGRNNLNIESLNHTFLTVADAESSIKLIEQQPVNVVLLSKKTIDEIRRNKDIAKMTTIDFKNYALKIIELDSSNASYLNKKYRLSYLYIESTGRIVLSALGFNPLVKGNVIDSMLERFAGNPETKELFTKMTESGK